MKKKRASGDGSIRKKPNGRWEGRYTVGIGYATGRAVQRSVSSSTQNECKENITDNRGVPINHNGDYPVAEWCRLWFETYSKPKPVAQHCQKLFQCAGKTYHSRHRGY